MCGICREARDGSLFFTPEGDYIQFKKLIFGTCIVLYSFEFDSRRFLLTWAVGKVALLCLVVCLSVGAELC